MRPRALGHLVALALAAWATHARAGFVTKVTHPYQAGATTHTIYTDAAVPLRLHVVSIDLGAQADAKNRARLFATRPEARGRTVSEFATCSGTGSGCVPSDIAINGDLFAPAGYRPLGLAMGDASVWPDAEAGEAWLAFGRDLDDGARVAIGTAGAAPAELALVTGIVGGHARLVQAGVATTGYDAADATEPFRPAPRAAVGLDAPAADGSHHLFYLVVVDGDQAASAGMTAVDLGRFLAGLGVWDALELDGGGSAALYIGAEGGIVNAPAGGVERRVADHLGVHFGPALPATITGQVYGDRGKTLATLATSADGLVVQVDGHDVRWNSDGNQFYADGVEPHFVCVTASARGYWDGRGCMQLTARQAAANSVQPLGAILVPKSAAAPDLGLPAGPMLPTSLAGSAGGGPMRPSAGACSVACPSGSCDQPLLLLVCLALAAFAWSRRAPW